jgi:hypothetical protein
MNPIECRWQSDGEEWHTGTLLAFVPVFGARISDVSERGGIKAMVALRTGRIVEMDYTRLRVGKDFKQ